LRVRVRVCAGGMQRHVRDVASTRGRNRERARTNASCEGALERVRLGTYKQHAVRRSQKEQQRTSCRALSSPACAWPRRPWRSWCAAPLGPRRPPWAWSIGAPWLLLLPSLSLPACARANGDESNYTPFRVLLYPKVGRKNGALEKNQIFLLPPQVEFASSSRKEGEPLRFVDRMHKEAFGSVILELNSKS
jgi:hypothetical protein